MTDFILSVYANLPKHLRDNLREQIENQVFSEGILDSLLSGHISNKEYQERFEAIVHRETAIAFQDFQESRAS